jgi:hypothetical protein
MFTPSPDDPLMTQAFIVVLDAPMIESIASCRMPLMIAPLPPLIFSPLITQRS